MLNKILYQGRLTADPELKHTQSEIAYLEFTVAWNEKYKEADTVCFLRCKAWRNNAEFISKWFQKGQEICIEGHMVTESWEKDGQKQNRTICMIDKAHFCGYYSNKEYKTEAVDKWVAVPDADDDELPFE